MFLTLLTIFFAILVLGVLVVIFLDDSDSGRKIAWILVIAILPAVGILLYFMFGQNLRHHWIYDTRHKDARDRFESGMSPQMIAAAGDRSEDLRVRKEYLPLVRLMSDVNYRRSGLNTAAMVTGGNKVEIITEGERKFELLCKDIAAAKESIHVEYFHFGSDAGSRTVRELLMLKASEGVKVRFLYENVANFPIPSIYYNDMKKAGVEIVKFSNPRSHLLPLVTTLNYRNHRKIVVIDGKIGYTGGMNINDNYFHSWRDTHLRIKGPAVGQLQYIFFDSWFTGKGTIDQPLPHYFPYIPSESPALPENKLVSLAEKASADSVATETKIPDNEVIRASQTFEGKPVNTEGKAEEAGGKPEEGGEVKGDVAEVRNMPAEKHKKGHDTLVQIVSDEPDLQFPVIQQSYEWAISNAKKYIYIQTPYFVPPEPVLHALQMAALSGVDVRIMLPERADNFLTRPVNRSFYKEILKAGVRLYLLQGRFIHSKTFVTDDYLSSVGSANLDYRSFSINFEVNTYIYGEDKAAESRNIFFEDMKSCHEMTLEEWEARPWYSRIPERFMRLFAPLL